MEVATQAGQGLGRNARPGQANPTGRWGFGVYPAVWLGPSADAASACAGARGAVWGGGLCPAAPAHTPGSGQHSQSVVRQLSKDWNEEDATAGVMEDGLEVLQAQASQKRLPQLSW